MSDREERALMKAIRDALGGRTRIDVIRRALLYTAQAAPPKGDGRAGVLAFKTVADKFTALIGYCALLPAQRLSPAALILMENAANGPLRAALVACESALPHRPAYAEQRAELRDLLLRGRAMIVTTPGAYFPAEAGDQTALLSIRRDIVLIADELAGLAAFPGFPRLIRDSLPNGRFIAFTSGDRPMQGLAEWDVRKIFGETLAD